VATINKEWRRLKFLAEKGRGDEKVHVAFVEEEAQKRIANAPEGEKPPKTRFQWETDFADGYSELNAGKDRLIRLIGNKQVAITIAAKLWNNTPDMVLRALSEDGPLTLTEIGALLESDWLYDILPGNGEDDYLLQRAREVMREIAGSR
jgi:hypothetical protein